MRVTQVYDVTISSGDPANQFTRATQMYNVAISSGDPLVQFVRPTQMYNVTISSGDPLIQFVRVTQTYLTVIYEPAVPIAPLLVPRRLMPPIHALEGRSGIGSGPFKGFGTIEVLDSQSLPSAPVSRGRNYGYIL